MPARPALCDTWAMLILDKTRTLDLMVARTECVSIPEPFALVDAAFARGPAARPSLLKGPPLPVAAPVAAATSPAPLAAEAPFAEAPFAWRAAFLPRHTAQPAVA